MYILLCWVAKSYHGFEHKSLSVEHIIYIFFTFSTICLLICTLISENQGSEKSRSILNPRKILGSSNLDLFSGLHTKGYIQQMSLDTCIKICLVYIDSTPKVFLYYANKFLMTYVSFRGQNLDQKSAWICSSKALHCIICWTKNITTFILDLYFICRL